MDGKILIIDDNEELLAAFRLFLSRHFEKVQTEKNPNRIPEYMRKDDWDVILLDMNFSAGVNTGNEGIYWMHEILKTDPQAIVVLLTAYGDVQLAVRSIKEGATDFIQKSWEEDKILSTILAACKLRKSKMEIKKLNNRQQHLKERMGEQGISIPCKSAAMMQVMQTLEKVANTEANILITGESGSGKEILAREIHERSARASEIFVPVDLGTLPPSLFESEMFGHVKGAFTDARDDKAGRIEIASGGTLFLDEIGNLPHEQQSKLLSVIQNRQIQRVGSVKSIPADFRLICATNVRIHELVKENKFREDLFYRINTIQIEIPPLRERIEDIPELAGFFLKEFSDKYRKTGLKLSAKALEKMVLHSWPGNVRELQHIVEKAVILCDSAQIEESDILFSPASRSQDPELKTFNLGEHEQQIISRALHHFKWNMSIAAKELGINRSTLYEKIKKYDIKPL